jgi:TonB family protein
MKSHGWRGARYVPLLVMLASPADPREAASGIGEDKTQERRVPELARMNELPIRRRVIHKVIPEYPKESISRGAQGVAVVAIRISAEGKVVTCRGLEAPEDEIGRSVCTAARQWTFQPVTFSVDKTEHPIPVDTKLTFYFQIEAGMKGIVSEPTVPPRGASIANTAGRFTELRVTAFEKDFAGKPGVSLVDIRDRNEFAGGRRAGAVNIPAAELTSRFRELATSRQIVIDCPASLQEVCAAVARSLSVDLPKAEIYVLLP